MGRLSHLITNNLSRRSFLYRVGLGLIGFLPAARALGQDDEPQSTPQQGGILIDETLAGIALYDLATNVIAKLGNPLNKQMAHGYGSEQWLFDGAMITFDCIACPEPRVKQIVITKPELGSTKAGVQVGSLNTDIEHLYGQVSNQLDSENLVIPLAPGRSLNFVLSNGVTSLISIQEDACSTCTVEDPKGPLEVVETQ